MNFRKLYVTAAFAFAAVNPAMAQDIKLGILLGFTGPGESLAPNMALSSELAWREASESGKLLDGATIVPVRGDDTCSDASTAAAAAERLVNSEGVAAIVGPQCSGITVSITRAITGPVGVVMISPDATSPAITELDDNDYTFRTVPSDARQGVVLAELAIERGIDAVAVTYVNDDYGKGLSSSFEDAFEELGGTVLLNAAHEDGRGDYSAEVGALSATGADVLVVFGRFDQGGRGIIQSSLDTGAFDRFILGDGMISDQLIKNIGSGLEGAFGTQPGSSSEAAEKFVQLAAEAGFDGDGGFRAESYDAAAVIALAIQAAGSADRAGIRDNLRVVANAPGEKIYPGEIGKALAILHDGGEIDYQGATGVEFDKNGEVPGAYRIEEVKNGKFEVIEVR
ncbi:ABC transporter substrate-binding protein [Pseudooceanicola atlanticus]|uniref:ABC transporter substrate-binding protein n=1 Tax=Pseudooceanicola atlanticus TaxID=1461694 RepID=UPI0023554C32|nr:ABC transporter substrate-binding protein [Pseudooceanicola atlanticus]